MLETLGAPVFIQVSGKEFCWTNWQIYCGEWLLTVCDEPLPDLPCEYCRVLRLVGLYLCYHLWGGNLGTGSADGAGGSTASTHSNWRRRRLRNDLGLLLLGNRIWRHLLGVIAERLLQVPLVQLQQVLPLLCKGQELLRRSQLLVTVAQARS